jgi:hypothetical protein
MNELEIEVKESLKAIKDNMRKYLINYESIKTELYKNVKFI